VPDHQKGVYEPYVSALAEAAIVSKAEIVYLPQAEIKERLLAAQIIDTEKSAAESPLAALAADLERQLANEDEAQLAIWDVEAVVANGAKCNRCWRYADDTANYGLWESICGRCRDALTEMGIAPPKPEATQ